MGYVLCAAAGLLLGFLIGKLLQANAYHKDVAQMILRSMELEEAMAAQLKKPSMIDYVVESRGMDYAILHYGNLFHILRGMPKKDETLTEVENAVGEFLQGAMREDIKKYKAEQKEQNKKEAKG